MKTETKYMGAKFSIGWDTDSKQMKPVLKYDSSNLNAIQWISK